MVIRNPKDTAISFFNFYKSMPALPTYESWNLFFKDFIHGNGNVLVLTYLKFPF